MYGYIYKISNSINDKVYIGQTTKTINERFKEHLRNCSQKSKKSIHLYLAMNKYGKDKFYIEQIDFAKDQKELDEKECYWIKFYDSINCGYNMIDGGIGFNSMNSDIVKNKHDSIMRTEKVRKSISSTMSQLRNSVGFSEEHKQKIKESRARRKEERTALGLNFYDHPENMASRCIPVYCILDTGERFDFKSILDAGKWWYINYKPFGEIYSTATYQRKIENSIKGLDIEYGNKLHKKYIKITNIKWFIREEGDSN